MKQRSPKNKRYVILPALAASAGVVLAAASHEASAFTLWTNALANGDINNAGNWGSGLPSDASGLGAVVDGTALTINQAFNNGVDNRSQFLVVGTGGLNISAGGSFTYLGDGLFGTTVSGPNGGAALITQTGGSLVQDGGGAGFLIGHNAIATYDISAGNVLVTGSAPSLTIDFDGAGAAAADGSSLNISGTGQVDVETGRNLVINSGGTLNVTGGGLLVWHDRTVAETAGFSGTVNALITQVGNDVHFTAVSAPVPEPSSTALLGLGGLAFMLRRRR